MTDLAHNTTNDTRHADFMSAVRELGRDAAAGKDSLPNLAIAYARAVYDGVIDPTKDTSGRDGAARVFEAYAAAEGKKAVHDRTENGLKANVSKLRKIGEAANNPKYDFVDVLNRAHVIRQQAKADDIDVKPAYAAFVDVAREQLKLDDAMDDAMLFATVTKTASAKEVTLEGKLKELEKLAEHIITGEKWAGVQDNSPEIHQISELVKQRLAALLSAKQDAEDEAKLAEILARKAERDAASAEVQQVAA